MRTVLFAILPELVLLDVAGAADAFRIAEREAPGNYQLRFVSTQSSVRAAVGLHLDKLEPLPEHVPDRELSTDVRHNLFLVVKEAINNTVKYARASELRLWIAVTDEKLELTVEDNGVGFEAPADDPGADGLRNMHQRMTDIGGQCWIQGRPGAGAKIMLELPWSQNGKSPSN